MEIVFARCQRSNQSEANVSTARVELRTEDAKQLFCVLFSVLLRTGLGVCLGLFREF